MASPLLTADTSVIVPSLLAWHALHAEAAAAVQDVRKVPAHALMESFSVLTRLPPPRALRPDQARRLLQQSFPQEPLTLSAIEYWAIIGRLADGDFGGGRVYDAVVGATVAANGTKLLTADRRAVPTYALMGADFKLLDQ